ncbi:hypothetical protein ACN28S_49595 [Cystobacter fuscus]
MTQWGPSRPDSSSRPSTHPLAGGLCHSHNAWDTLERPSTTPFAPRATVSSRVRCPTCSPRVCRCREV